MPSRSAVARKPRSVGSRPPAEPLRNNAVRHLAVISRDLELRMTSGLVEEQGFDSLRASLGPLFFLIWAEPRPITKLARQLGVTKQACSQLANLAERAGYVDRIPSPEDGRSKLLRLSDQGRRIVEEAIEIVRKADADYSAIVGPRRYARFTKTIAALYKALDVPGEEGMGFLERATRTVGTLPLVTERAQRNLMKATASRGHDGLKMSHGDVLPYVRPGGVRSGDLTRFHGERRQAVQATIRDLVALGYLRREADPADGRGVLLFPTKRGERLLADSVAELEALEKRIEAALGTPQLVEFRETAEKLHVALAVGDELFDAAGSSSVGTPRSGPRATRSDVEMERLAARLRRELGSQRSAELAALLTESVE